jgi:hypothetical protein
MRPQRAGKRFTLHLPLSIAHHRKTRGGAVARDILRDKIEGKGVSRRTAYRRIEEAEKLKLIKFHKGKDAYELY